jgi:hypothetical protein
MRRKEPEDGSLHPDRAARHRGRLGGSWSVAPMLRRGRGGVRLGAPFTQAEVDAGRRCAGGLWPARPPTNRPKAEARLVFGSYGSVLVQSGTQDLGTGTYTVISQIAADALKLPLHQIRFVLGDSRFPPPRFRAARKPPPVSRRLCWRPSRRQKSASLPSSSAPIAPRSPVSPHPTSRWKTGLCWCAPPLSFGSASRRFSPKMALNGSKSGAHPRPETRRNSIRCIPSARNSPRCGSIR